MAKAKAKGKIKTKAPATRILEDVPRPSHASVMEAFYGGSSAERRIRESEPQDRGHEIPIDRLTPNPAQPRKHFDQDQLASLIDSIKEVGLLQPIVVRPHGDRFQIICGERRYRACISLGIKAIRAEIREVDDTTAYQLALAENIQRNSLTAVEEALAYQQMMAQGMGQSDVARVLGIDRRRVSEKLSLLHLPEELQQLLSARADTFSERHARLLSQTSPKEIDVIQLGRRCAENGWSTRQLEAEIARAIQREEPAETTSPRLFENIHYSLNKRGGFTLTVRARSRQEVARTITELERKLAEMRVLFSQETSARADKGRAGTEIES